MPSSIILLQEAHNNQFIYPDVDVEKWSNQAYIIISSEVLFMKL